MPTSKRPNGVLPEDLAGKVARMADEDWQFRGFLKECDDRMVDAAVRRLFWAVSKEVDCRQCRNCCIELTVPLTAKDIGRLAAAIGMEPGAFKEKYLAPDKDEPANFVMKKRPCPFLRTSASAPSFFGSSSGSNARKSHLYPRQSRDMAPRKQAPVFQFKIILEGTSPPVWRRIQIPADCTFWDLHVAIQDAMGWLDYHLHLFTVQHPVKGVGEIGIPSDEDDGFGRPVLPGWKENVSGWLTPEHNSADYEYDFGDGWRHQVIFEKALPREKGAKYPRCIDGKRACPPEDCGGIPGYQQICRGKSEFQDQFADYDPDAFDPGKVRFDDPKKRFKTMMSHDEGP